MRYEYLNPYQRAKKPFNELSFKEKLIILFSKDAGTKLIMQFIIFHSIWSTVFIWLLISIITTLVITLHPSVIFSIWFVIVFFVAMCHWSDNSDTYKDIDYFQKFYNTINEKNV